MTYKAKYAKHPLSLLDPLWEKASASPLSYSWEGFLPIPYPTEVALSWSDEGLSVRFESREWPLRATHTVCNGEICEDSCMELFFTPNEQGGAYLNIEANPFGVSHVGLGEEREGRRLLDIEGEGLRIETHIRYGEGWSLGLFIPFSFIDRYLAPRTSVWRFNCYKCGDLTVKEHYATLAPVGTPEPDYHRPEYFATLLFSEEAL